MKIIRKIYVILLFISVSVFAGDELVLNWNDCVSEIIRNNPALASYRQQVIQNKDQKWIELSPVFPQITSEFNANKSDSFTNDVERNQDNYSLRGEQLIFDGFKVYNDVKSANENIRASEHSYTVGSSDIRYNARSAFVELLRAQSLVPIMQRIIARRKQNLDMIRLRYESGREHEGSLLLAEADLAQAQYDLRKARRGISAAQYALRKELGWTKDIPIKVTGQFRLQNSLNDKPDLEVIARSHPLTKKRNAERKSAEFGVGSAKAEFFPTVSVNAEAGKIRTSFTTDDRGWTVGINAALPIFEGGRRIANTKKAKAALRQAQEDERRQFDTVLSELDRAWQEMRDAIEEVSVQAKYLKANEMRAKISRAQYANGLLIFDNWIIIEDNYVRSQTSYLEARANMLIAEAAWMRARGESLNYD